MYCLKCGNETPNQQVFCPECLEVMEQYPVKPDTPVQLPNRNALAKNVSRAQYIVTPEEQIAKLRSANRRLAVAIGILCLALAVAVGAMFYFLNQPEEELPTGQNYSVRRDR